MDSISLRMKIGGKEYALQIDLDGKPENIKSDLRQVDRVSFALKESIKRHHKLIADGLKTEADK